MGWFDENQIPRAMSIVLQKAIHRSQNGISMYGEHVQRGLYTNTASIQ